MPNQQRPNILLYCTDQQRFDTIGALGNPYVKTPNLDALVESGTSFTHTYCQSPICTPSRASFMTGMYPSRIRNCRNGNDTWENHPPLISKLLADADYRCGMVGKFHLQSSGHRTEPRLDDGYHYWRFSHAPRDDWEKGHDYANWVRSKQGDLDTLRESENRVPPELHQTTWVTDCAIEFFEETANQSQELSQAVQPWFLTLNPYDPHPPFIPPKVYAEQFNSEEMPGVHFEESDIETQRKLADVAFQTLVENPDDFDAKQIQALYYAMIAQIDEQFGRLIKYLDDSGQRENTVIIFCSDHGEMLGDHGLLYKGCRFYEGLVRVPLIVSLPKVQQDTKLDALVELTDMSATILDIAGITQPEAMQGRSLMSLIHGETLDLVHRSFVRSEYFDALDGSFTQGSLSYGTMYRNKRFKLCVYHTHGLGELYDLDADPWEHNNLWDNSDYQTLKSELLLASFNATVEESIDVGSKRIAPM